MAGPLVLLPASRLPLPMTSHFVFMAAAPTMQRAWYEICFPAQSVRNGSKSPCVCIQFQISVAVAHSALAAHELLENMVGQPSHTHRHHPLASYPVSIHCTPDFFLEFDPQYSRTAALLAGCRRPGTWRTCVLTSAEHAAAMATASWCPDLPLWYDSVNCRHTCLVQGCRENVTASLPVRSHAVHTGQKNQEVW